MRIYVDTSVVGGYFDDEFAVETKQFFDLRNEVLRLVRHEVGVNV